jgi:hypothetical protein
VTAPGLRLEHVPRGLVGVISIGLAIGVVFGALEHRIVTPSGELMTLADGARATSHIGLALKSATISKGQALSGFIDLSLDDGVRGLNKVDVAVLPVGPAPPPTLAIIATHADPSVPGRLVFHWDPITVNRAALDTGTYELFIVANLRRDASDRRPPFVTQLASFSVK